MVLACHPKGRDYRVAVQTSQIVVCERLGPDIDTLSAIFGEFSPLPSAIVRKRIQEQLDKMARFSPVLCFLLVDSEERKFIAERWSYLGNVEDWIDISESGSIDNLARQLIPKLGTDDFFELF